MTNKEILLKALKKAIDNGYKDEDDTYLFYYGIKRVDGKDSHEYIDFFEQDPKKLKKWLNIIRNIIKLIKESRSDNEKINSFNMCNLSPKWLQNFNTKRKQGFRQLEKQRRTKGSSSRTTNPKFI